ncbi:MAG TPA: transketolase family protein, partial [Thermosynergistes sp.]|nr:transketolase family protein [Thermosynergistes sp.]
MEEKALLSLKDAVAEALIHLCETDDRTVVLNADISSCVGLHDFASRFPERAYNLGVAEQDLVLTAAGM